MASKNESNYKVVLIGEGEVGKSALTLQYVTNVFLDFHEPTIEDVYQAQTVIENEVAILDILDTAAQSDLEMSMKEQYLRQGDGYICMYSITDINSFQRLQHHIAALKRIRSVEKIPMVIVGNKLDLSAERKISTMQGVTLARECDCPFYETSASTRTNIEYVFSSVVKEIRRINNENNKYYDIRRTKSLNVKNKKKDNSKTPLRRLTSYVHKKLNYFQSEEIM